MVFLIQYDRALGRIVDLERFDDGDRSKAEDARFALEVANVRSPGSIEVVLLDAASEDALRKTHRRYFETLEELGESVASR